MDIPNAAILWVINWLQEVYTCYSIDFVVGEVPCNSSHMGTQTVPQDVKLW